MTSTCHSLLRPIAAAIISLPFAAAFAANSGGVLDGSNNYYGTGSSNQNVSVSEDELQHVRAGTTDEGDSEENVLTVSGGSISGQTAAGITLNGNSKKNQLVISGSTFANTVWAGYSGKGNAEENTADISGGAFSDVVYGGYALDGEAIGNQITFRGTAEGEGLVGGRSKNSSAQGNKVFIEGGRIVGKIDGDGLGYSASNVVGGFVYDGSTGDASGNVVEISGGTINAYVTGGLVSGVSGTSAAAHGNQVAVSGGTVNGKVFGGRTLYGAVYENEVAVSGGTLTGDVYGGQTYCAGFSAEKNSVDVRAGATVTGSVYGGWSRSAASDNKVVVSGSVTGNAYGGFAEQGETSRNALYLQGSASVGGTAYAQYGSTGSGGLAEVQGTVSVGALKGFDELRFVLTADNAETPALTLTKDESTLDLTSAEVSIDAAALSTAEKGAKLVAAKSGTFTLAWNADTRFENKVSLFVDGEWTLDAEAAGEERTMQAFYINSEGDLAYSTEEGEFVLAEGRYKLASNSKTLSESRLGTAAFVNQGAEFIADEGLAAMAGQARAGEWRAFGAIAGGSSEYETGSHVDVDGVTLAAGMSGLLNDVVLAGFVEVGWASSESHVQGTNADGDHDYYGVGAAALWRLPSGFHLDGSVRLGQASTDFDGIYSEGVSSYESDVFYSTFHVGGGWTIPIRPGLKADVYGRYVFTYLDGDDLTLGDEQAERLHLDDTMTHALRVGVRLAGEATQQLSWRGGLAYEHVFDGDAEGTVNGLVLDVPSLSGDTVIGELGLDVAPSPTSPWSAHFAIKGYAGDRTGVVGSAMAVYAF